MTTAPSETITDVSKLTFETVLTRRRIIASYWLVVLLALPLWWKITSIDRLSLPAAKIHALEGKELHFPIQVHLGSGITLDAIKIQLQAVTRGVLQSHGLELDVSAGRSSPNNGSGSYQVRLQDGIYAPSVQGRQLSGSAEPAVVAEGLSRLLVPHAFRTASEAHRTVKYAPRYRLAFTLLNEDASSGKAALAWELENAIAEYLQPTLERLSILHNFTIESQVQYHAPLAFKPQVRVVDHQTIHGLTPEDLTVFVNSAEWTLSSSVSNDPVIHFVLFVPSALSSPMYILDQNGSPTSSNAFILPQWGGIVLLNGPSQHLSATALSATFSTFRHQLLTLLGVPNLPAGFVSDDSQPFTDWQLDALIRQRTRENVENSKETLRSIVALVNQIENMPVGQDVKGDVQGALAALEAVYSTASSSSTRALQLSSEALTLSSRAFFNPGMLALLYFPAEHKYAVYTPLFASIAAPLVAALIREYMAWKKTRKEKAETESSTPSVKHHKG